jgi:hypothetical protein
MGLVHFVREMRGVPIWLLREYLQELGGKLGEDGIVAGEGWSAYLVQLDDYQIGALRVGQVRLDLDASPDAWEDLRPRLEKKLLRAGG